MTPSEEKTELVKKLMGEVYQDGFNIYKCLNKLKKQLKLTEDFPQDAIIWTCEAYLRDKPKVRDHYPWFVRVFKASSEKFFSTKHEAEGKKHKKAPIPQSIKDIMRNI